MKKQFIFAVLAAFSLSSATAQMLKGFAYGDQEAPRGYNYVKGQEPGLAEWESPQELSLNKDGALCGNTQGLRRKANDKDFADRSGFSPAE